jgi:chromosome segregation ATPase
MQSKSTRGVQQEDVWAAADHLISEGLRPTIERVRLRIGRGSPNTVSPMLDAWFATLGSRLGVTDDKKAVGGELPAPLRQAMTKLWELALLSAQGVAEQGLLQARQILAAERSTMEHREADIVGKEQVLKERLSAMDEALQVARGQIADLTSRLEQSQALTNKRDAEIDALHLKFSDLEIQRVAAQRRSEEIFKHHAEERRQLEERATITERRLMTELDRERQETKRLKLNLQQTAQQAETVGNQFQAEKQTLLQKQLDAQSELRSARQALVLANERAAELRGLLDEQRTANGAAIAQLSQLLIEATLKAPVIAKSRKRVNSKASNPRNP